MRSWSGPVSSSRRAEYAVGLRRCGRTGYSELEAMELARSFVERYGIGTNAVRCEDCGSWHLQSAPKQPAGSDRG